MHATIGHGDIALFLVLGAIHPGGGLTQGDFCFSCPCKEELPVTSKTTLPIKWIAARVQIGTAKEAKSELPHLAQS